MVKKIFSVCAAALLSLVFSVGVFAASFPLPDEVVIPVDELVSTFKSKTGLDYPYIACFWVRNGGRPYIDVFHSSKPLDYVEVISHEYRPNVQLHWEKASKFYFGRYSLSTGFDASTYRVDDYSAYGSDYSMGAYIYGSDPAAPEDQTSSVPVFSNSGLIYVYDNGVKGGLFFPGTLPLSEVVGELQVGAGGTLATRLGADLSTLVPFGIGLLALLTALPVLLRVLRRFLR